MNTKDEINEFHINNIKLYVGKNTDKGIIEKIEYLTFINGISGGNYHSLPQVGQKGLVCGRIKNKSYPIGELKFI